MRESLRKAGQRVVVGFDGHAASRDVAALIRDYGAGGVLLFSRNVDAPGQLAELVRELQGLARDAGHELPLLVGVDQEGGRVARLKAPWTLWPSARVLGRTGSEDLAERWGGVLAAELKACGILMDLAPVVDVDSNPDNPVINDRSFGPDAGVVSRLGAAFIRGLQGAGVAAAAKHFPGHGDTSLDSHLALPAVDHDRSRLDEVELPPFRAAIAAGVASVVTAHILVREIDPEAPATLSREVVTGLLRGELSYGGVVITDDLEMKAVAERYPAGEAARRAALAGCDLVLVCHTPEAQVEAVEALVRAGESEEIPFSDMDLACGRIREMKRRFVLPYVEPDPAVARSAAGAPRHRALAAEIRRSGGEPAEPA